MTNTPQHGTPEAYDGDECRTGFANYPRRVVTYELCYDPRDADMLVYRSIHAGVCGPFSEHVPCSSREDAERIANDMGYKVVSEWASHTNYDSADLIRMA